MMPKKNFSNSVDKLNQQIEYLKKKEKYHYNDNDTREELPVHDRKKINKTINNTSKLRENIIVDSKKYKKESKQIRDNIVTIPEKKVKEKNNNAKEIITKEEGLSSEETIKFRKLENEMHSLYDKVNDVVDDIENTKTIELDQDIIDKAINKTNFEKNISKISKDIDDIDQDNLNKIVNTLAIIFGVLLFLFLIFIIFISVV